ncbi:MAG: amidohydrolase [Erysipelotrichaceae bacterium]|nr:amidohydrolase [Erysipelotrichaceae bacterium]
MNLKEQALSLQPDLVAWRRELHQFPELGLKTYKTAEIIERELRKMGIDTIEKYVDGAGLAVTIHGAKPGKCVAIRVDTDGLPITESTNLDFASKNPGVMHACGHDTHTAMGLGAVKLLLDNRDTLTGSVKVIFQPGEEGAGGAKRMIEEGVLENPKVEAAIGIHCTVLDSRLPEFPAGSIAVTTGFPSSACSTGFYVKFKGKGAHGMSPHLSVDPIFMGASAIMQLQGIVSRENNPLNKLVVSIGHVEAGKTSNVIPEVFYLDGTIRSLDYDYSMHVLQRITTICTSVAESMGGTCEITSKTIPEVKIDKDLLTLLRKSAAEIIPEEQIYTFTEPTMGGEDFSFFSMEIPTVHFRHSQRFCDNRDQYPTHNANFISCEDGYWSGSAILAKFAMDWLNENA